MSNRIFCSLFCTLWSKYTPFVVSHRRSSCASLRNDELSDLEIDNSTKLSISPLLSNESERKVVMSGVDVRGHAREGSIARKRSGIASTAPPLASLNSTPSRSTQPLDSPLKSYARRGASPRVEESSGGFLRENGFLVKLLTGVVALLLLGYYGVGMVSERSVRAGGRERKHRLSGTAGEGWVLPRKWREYDAGNQDTQVAEGEVLPVCKRVLLHVFDESVFLSSLVSHFLTSIHDAVKRVSHQKSISTSVSPSSQQS